jgi:hypothetical protein
MQIRFVSGATESARGFSAVFSADCPELKTGEGMYNRVRPRFFDQVGHQTTNVSIGSKYFFTK